MKALTKISIGFLALAAVALWFTSCSSEDVASGTNQGNQESILLLSFNTGKMGTRATTTNLTAEEKNIEDMTIGIYSSDGQKLRTVQTLTKANSESEAPAGSNKFYIDGSSGNAVAKIVTTAALTAGDQVLVAANTGSADFSKKGNVDGFKSVEIDATTALTADGTTLAVTKLPKFGASSGKLQPSSNKSEFTASDIKLKNLVSKITLKSITVNFTSPGPYASATFEPQEMYLESVPAKMQFSETAWVGDPGSSYLSGKEDAGKDFKGFLKVTLSTPSGEGASKVLSASNPTFTGTDADVLYTIPNIKTDEHKTVLVIKGQFGSETVYYKLPLNVKSYNPDGTPKDPVADGTSAFQIPSGKNIKCSITINTIGSTNPDAESGPLTATLTVTVDPWDDLDQNTTFQ